MKKLLLVFVWLFCFSLVGCSSSDQNVTRFNTDSSGADNNISTPEKTEIKPEEKTTLENIPQENKNLDVKEENSEKPTPSAEGPKIESEAVPVTVEEVIPKDEVQTPVKDLQTFDPIVTEKAQEKEVNDPNKSASPVEKTENSKSNSPVHSLPKVGPNLWPSLLLTIMAVTSYALRRKIKYS